MKVLNLRCAGGHGFEGWFGSEDDYAAQAAASGNRLPACAQHRDQPLAERAAPRTSAGTQAPRPRRLPRACR
jgi:hypothetical protein